MDESAQVTRTPNTRSRWLARLLRLWAWTWRVRWHEAHGLPWRQQQGPVVLAFWHEDLAVLGPLHADRGIVGMVSRSEDGELLSGVLEALGYQTVRGSSSRGARAVALGALRAVRSGLTVAMAVDGPRGPRRQVRQGAERIAALAGCPVVLVGCRVWPALRLSSWDRQRIPAPFARIEVFYEGWVAEGALGAQLAALGMTDARREQRLG